MCRDTSVLMSYCIRTLLSPEILLEKDTFTLQSVLDTDTVCPQILLYKLSCKSYYIGIIFSLEVLLYRAISRSPSCIIWGYLLVPSSIISRCLRGLWELAPEYMNWCEVPRSCEMSGSRYSVDMRWAGVGTPSRETSGSGYRKCSQDKVFCRVLPCPASYVRLAGGSTGQKAKARPVLQDRRV